MNRSKIMLSALYMASIISLRAMEQDPDDGYNSSDSCAAHQKGISDRYVMDEYRFKTEVLADYDVDPANPGIEFCEKKPREVTINGHTYQLSNATIVSRYLVVTPESSIQPQELSFPADMTYPAEPETYTAPMEISYAAPVTSYVSSTAYAAAPYAAPAMTAYPSMPTAYPDYPYIVAYNPYAFVPQFTPYARTVAVQAVAKTDKPLTRTRAISAHKGQYPYDLHQLGDTYAMVCYLSKSHPRGDDIGFGRGYSITYYKKPQSH